MRWHLDVWLSLLRLWYLCIYQLNKMKISELWLTAQTQIEMVFFKLKKVIQETFLIATSGSSQNICILVFQFKNKKTTNGIQAKYISTIDSLCIISSQGFRKVEHGDLMKRFPCQWRNYRNPKWWKSLPYLNSLHAFYQENDDAVFNPIFCAERMPKSRSCCLLKLYTYWVWGSNPHGHLSIGT